MTDGWLHLIASSSEGAVESLLALILRNKTAQEHVILARDMGNHKKATKRAIRTLYSYYIQEEEVMYNYVNITDIKLS